jgi:hypothetical protein
MLTGGSGNMGRNLNKDFSSWNDQDSVAIRNIRMACSLLASCGSSSSGCPEDFKVYLASKEYYPTHGDDRNIGVFERPLFLIFQQITPVNIKLFKDSSQFSEIVEKAFVDNMLIGH